MTKVLPDTNVWIAFFKGYQPVADQVADLLRQRRVILSVVTVSEFLVGVNKKADRINMELLAQEFGIQPITWEIGRLAAQIRKEMLRKKKRVLLLDCFIAATAKHSNAKVLTFDKTDYVFDNIEVEVVSGIV